MMMRSVPGMCANVMCVNRLGDGAWVLLSVPGTDKPVVLSMCLPCGSHLGRFVAMPGPSEHRSQT